MFDTSQFVTQAALMFIGGVSTWAVWVTASHYKVKKDLDIAFDKIRNIEKEIGK